MHHPLFQGHKTFSSHRVDLAIWNSAKSIFHQRKKNYFSSSFFRRPNATNPTRPATSPSTVDPTDVVSPVFGSCPLAGVDSTGLPDVGSTGLPGVGSTGLPGVGSTGLSGVGFTGLSGVGSTGLSGVGSTGLSGVSYTFLSLV